MWPLFASTCQVSEVQTNNCIVAAATIPAASAPSFPSATSITDSLSLTRYHAGCWRYSLCYESACDLVIGLLHCNDHQYYGTQRPFSRELAPSLLKMCAHFQESVDFARSLKIRFLKMGRLQAHKIFFLEIRKWPDFRFQESWILVP